MVHVEELFEIHAGPGSDRIDLAELAALHRSRRLVLATTRGDQGQVTIGPASPQQTVLELLRLAAIGQLHLDQLDERLRETNADLRGEARHAEVEVLVNALGGYVQPLLAGYAHA